MQRIFSGSTIFRHTITHCGSCAAFFYVCLTDTAIYIEGSFSMNDTFMKDKPVFPLIMSMALPMVISMLVNSLYNIVDSFFVAQISENAMTALSLVFPIQNFANAIAIGFGIGISSQIAICLGAGNRDTASKAATHGLALSGLHGVVLTIVCILVMPGFLALFTGDTDVIDLGIRYSTIVFLFATINTLNLAYEKIFQGVGQMKVTMIGLLVGCVSNIILDPLLIFGIGPFPSLGIEGAAIATGLGQVFNLVFYLIVYRIKPIQVKLSRRYLQPDKVLAMHLYSVGIPGALNLALPSVLVSALNGLLAAYSQSYVVILGIYYKLQTFLYLPASGIVQGMRPVIGYNYGAGEHKRVKKIYFVTLGMSGVIMLIGTVICLSVPGQLMGMFTTNPETIAAGKTALRIICAGFLVSSVSVTACGALEGLGRGSASLVVSLCRYLIIILPVAFILSRIFGAVGVWHAFWIAETLTAGVSFLISRKIIGV